MRLHWLARSTAFLGIVLLSGCPKGGNNGGGDVSTPPADTAAAARDSTATDTTP